MPDYNGFANWGTWNLTNIVWGDLEEEIAEGLAAIPLPNVVRSMGRWCEGADFVRERMEGLVAEESRVADILGRPLDPVCHTPVTETLMREGADNIDWDALALYWRRGD